MAKRGSSASVPGDYSPWGFEGNGIGEKFSLWDNPTGFSSQGGSSYTFLDYSISSQGGSAPEPKTQNTISSDKTTSNTDVAARMEMITKQRESEFGTIARK